MKRNHITLYRLIFTAVTTLAFARGAPAQTVVQGTGNPDVDVPAVQAAVDQGGEVVLKGHFSFNRPPTVVLPPPFQGSSAMVLVSKAVTLSGGRDERDDDREMTTIEAGTIPFYVEAPGASVSIQGLRFLRPISDAILVFAVSGLTIASCKIEGVEPADHFSGGISIDTSGAFVGPGHPENISGRLLIVNNDIDMAGGTARDATLGIILFYVGVPGSEVEAYVSGNRIRNFTERAFDVRGVGGRTFVEANVIATGAIAGSNAGALQPIFVADPTTNLDSYLIAHNSVDVQWPTGSAAGISVRQLIAHAIVVDNDVNMGAPEGTIFDSNSAGIEITGNVQGSVVLNNRIRGRARTALAAHWRFLVPPVLPLPANTAFVLNRFDHFEASLADVFVGDCVTNNCVTNTLIVGQGTVEDHGVGTVIVPVSNFGRNHEEGGDENRDHTGEEPREK